MQWISSRQGPPSMQTEHSGVVYRLSWAVSPLPRQACRLHCKTAQLWEGCQLQCSCASAAAARCHMSRLVHSHTATLPHTNVVPDALLELSLLLLLSL